MLLDEGQKLEITEKIKSNTIDSRWQIIEAYLYLFAKADLLKLEGKFRLYKFLNTVKPNQKGKHQVFVLHLLYLIFDGKKKEFMKECDNIEGYIHRHKSIPSRARYFLRLLHCVEKGDYNKLRVQAHAKKNLALLRSNARHLDIEVFDNEPVPFERLWGMVVDGLGK